MLDALIGGPELALRYAASLRRCEKTDWCDPSWADGGAVSGSRPSPGVVLRRAADGGDERTAGPHGHARHGVA